MQRNEARSGQTGSGLRNRRPDLTEDVNALDHIKSLGFQQAPVVFAGDDAWSGFRPDKIKALAATALTAAAI